MRRLISAMVLVLMIFSQVIDHHFPSAFTGWFVVAVLIIAAVIMFIWSGNDSKWAIEKWIARLFRR